MEEEQKALGCGWQALIAASVLIAVTLFLALRPAGSYLPSGLRTSETLEVHEEGFFRERCLYTAYRLDPEVTSRIRSNGRDYLSSVGTPKGSGQPYGRWQPTPAGGEVARSLGAQKCGGAPRRTSIDAALAAPGAYYSLSQNEEGLMVVDPQTGVAWYLYFG